MAKKKLKRTGPKAATIAISGNWKKAVGTALKRGKPPKKPEPVPTLDPTALDDVPRILALSPEDRLREVANISRFVAAAKPVPKKKRRSK